jgi:hypothetical protein
MLSFSYQTWTKQMACLGFHEIILKTILVQRRILRIGKMALHFYYHQLCKKEFRRCSPHLIKQQILNIWDLSYLHGSNFRLCRFVAANVQGV